MAGTDRLGQRQPRRLQAMANTPIMRRDFSRKGLVTYRSTRMSFSYVVAPATALTASIGITGAYSLRIMPDSFFRPYLLTAESTYDTTSSAIATQTVFNSFSFLATSRNGGQQLSDQSISQQSIGVQGLKLEGIVWQPQDQIDFVFTNLIAVAHTPKLTFHGYKIFAQPC